LAAFGRRPLLYVAPLSLAGIRNPQQIRKSALTGGTRTDRIADITGRQFRASSSFPTQKKPDAKKFQQQFA